MTRLLLAAVLAGAALTTALAWTIRSEVACAAELPPAVQAEPAEDLWRGAAAGCVQAGGTWWMGSESGVVVARCRPWLDAGVTQLPKGGRR